MKTYYTDVETLVEDLATERGKKANEAVRLLMYNNDFVDEADLVKKGWEILAGEETSYLYCDGKKVAEITACRGHIEWTLTE